MTTLIIGHKNCMDGLAGVAILRQMLEKQGKDTTHSFQNYGESIDHILNSSQDNLAFADLP